MSLSAADQAISQPPLFSVVIPAYNAEAFVEEALDSVSAQTFPDYEVLLVDDGSSDSTASRAALWAAAHPEIRWQLISQPNKGIGGSRNAGVFAARGDYLAFLDVDDLWLPEKLARVARFLKESGSPDLVCHDEWLAAPQRLLQRSTYGPYQAYSDLLFKKNTISTSATVVRRERVWEIDGFSEDLNFNGVEDYDLWMRLAKSGCRIEYLHEVLGIYRIHEQSITAGIDRHCQNALNLLEHHFRDWPEQNIRSWFRQRRRQGAVLRGAGHSFLKRADDRGAARRYLGRAMLVNPLDWKTWVLMLITLAPVKY